jgi:hypothetical protein
LKINEWQLRIIALRFFGIWKKYFFRIPDPKPGISLELFWDFFILELVGEDDKRIMKGSAGRI